MYYIQELLRDPVATLTVILLALPGRMLALSMHEAAHAYVADRCGDPTARNLGRLTLNPLKHIDILGFLMLYIVGFGWAKPVPINPRNYKGDYRKCDLKVSLAGITMNLILFLAGALVLYGVMGLALARLPQVSETALNLFGSDARAFITTADGMRSVFIDRGDGYYSYWYIHELLTYAPYAGEFVRCCGAMFPTICSRCSPTLCRSTSCWPSSTSSPSRRWTATMYSTIWCCAAAVCDRRARESAWRSCWCWCVGATGRGAGLGDGRRCMTGAGRGGAGALGALGDRLMAYIVSLKQFDGPLDLLLTLIPTRRSTFTISSSPRSPSSIWRSMKLVDELDMDSASEFLQMAATLLEIKSRAMLPKPPKPEDENELSPEEALIRQLEEYRQFKEISGRMQELEKQARALITKLPEEYPLPPPVTEITGLTLEKLQRAFLRVLERARARRPAERMASREIRRDSFTVSGCMARIRAACAAARSPSRSCLTRT